MHVRQKHNYCDSAISRYVAACGYGWQVVVSLCLAISLVACSNNDLSEIDDYYRARLAAGASNVEFRGDLIVDQLSVSNIANSSGRHDAQFSFHTGTKALSGNINISSVPVGATVQAVELWRGDIGRTGTFIAPLKPCREREDGLGPDNYCLVDNIILDDSDDEDRLFDGGIYIRVTTDQQGSGQLRAQLLPEWKQLLVNTLTAEQVVQGPVTTTASARSFLILDILDREIRGSVRHSSDIAPNPGDVRLYAGLPGQTGEPIFSFQEDSANPGVWRVPESHRELSDAQLRQLGTAGLYVQISSSTHPHGELRTQIYFRDYQVYIPSLDDYFPSYDIWTVRLSDETPGSQTPMDATGKAFVTIEYDDDQTFIRGVVRVNNMMPGRVALVRITSLNNPDNRQEISHLIPEEDYWRLPLDEDAVSLSSRDLTDISQGRLYFIATSVGQMGGEIAGRL